ncbi:dTDP-4-dehydrorhamnose reductase [Zavarzinia sp. CC-PAN008]|uniref:dTDP-4-dehydrorhamnose reductase n=1 Tax=Zavarzinia sp. CC-PAN008 TaxID=3243332 RepID=UPI003F7441B9
MRILVLGRHGQVAQELARHGPATGCTVACVGREQAQPASVAALIADARPVAVINAAAYNAVDQAEQEEALAMAVNATLPGVAARVCAALGVPFLHISTGYVFAGDRPGAYAEDDAPGPLGAYGRSKLAGEAAVRAAGGHAAIVRTSWVFSPFGSNFVKTMLRVGAANDAVQVVDDQHGQPTCAADLAQALLVMARAMVTTPAPGQAGLFHLTGAGPLSWAGFAEEIFAASTLHPRPRVVRIASADYPVPARRPANGVLDCRRIGAVFGVTPADWRIGLAHVLAELGAR